MGVRVPRKAASGLALVGVMALYGAVCAQPKTALFSFTQAVTLAEGGPAVRLAAGQLELARGELGAASAFVSGELSAGYTRDLTPATDGDDLGAGNFDTGDFDPVTASATFSVLPFGDAADAAREAERAVRAAEAAFGAAKADAVVAAATAYLEALRLGQEENALKAAVGVAETALEATRTRLEVGAASDADLLDAQIALSQARNDLAEVALEEAQALAALAQTLGVGVPAVAGEPPEVTLPELGDVTARLENRADVVAARLAVENASQARAAALRGALPSGTVGLEYGDDDVQVGAGFSTESLQPSLEFSYDPDGLPGEQGEPLEPGLSARVGVSIPLDGGVGAGLAVAETAVANAELLLGQTRAQAALELQAARNQLATTENSLAAGRALVEQRELALATTRTRLELGLVPPLEVERAEAELLAARVERGRLEDNALLARLILLQTLAVNPLEVF